MSALALSQEEVSVSALMPPSATALATLALIHERTLEFPQCELVTEHILHGGMYARTIRLGPGTIMNGSLILAPTILIVQGSCDVLGGESVTRLEGFNVLPGMAGRKQTFLTHGPVEMTMIFPTQARTIREAEDEIFAEVDQLMSRKDGSKDRVIVTEQ